MTGIAMQALKNSDTIIGYTVYVDLVKDTFPDKEFLTTPMKKEVDRCVLAFEEAMKGKSVSMICSGDAGVYGMAGLMYEVGMKYPEVELEIVPGVTAALGGAAVLGAHWQAGGRGFLSVPALLYRLRPEHHHWQQRVSQHQLPLSGSGRHHHRRRHPHRPQCGAGHSEP